MKRKRDFGKEKNSGVSFSMAVFMRIGRKNQLLCKLYRTDFPAKRSVDRMGKWFVYLEYILGVKTRSDKRFLSIKMHGSYAKFQNKVLF